MKDVTITHISLSNFCHISSLDADLTKKSLIKGFNKEGKSTIKNAILWCLTDKLSDGSAAGDNIRPHDANGNRIDGVDICVSLTVSVDGSEFILTKAQKQKWVKKRGCEDREFQGNENLYEISGVPKKAKDYEAFIDENICKAADLSFCINANTFFALDAKKGRAKILSLGKSFTTDEIIDKCPEFESLRSDLKVGTVEELTARSKKAITELKRIQNDLPVRIDEANNSIIDMDFADLEKQRNEILEKMKSIDGIIEQQNAIIHEINKAQVDLQTVKGNLTSDIRTKKQNLHVEISELKLNLDRKKMEISSMKSKIEQYRQVIATSDAKLTTDNVSLTTAKAREFDANSFVCPTCGQLYPLEKQDENRRKFEALKANEIAKLTEGIEVGKRFKADNEILLKAAEKSLVELEGDAECIREEITTKEMEMESIPNIESIDYANDPEYKAAEKKIADLKAKADSFMPKNDKGVLMAQLEEVNKQLARKDANAKAIERIAELKEEQKNVAKKVLDQESILHLLERFNIKRIELLEASVNQYFGIVKWKFFEKQINGGYQEVCKATVDGIDYDTLLNKSDRLLCQADLMLGFQKAADVSLPIMIDDIESIDSGRIPEFDRQVILFKRDDCKLTVERA
jgi:hypothetical protein